MIKNLAPQVFRQRLLIEGFYRTEVDPISLEDYFNKITETLSLRMYAKPIIFSTGDGKPENQGYDAFVPLIDSGISVYVWVEAKFFSGIIYTCKKFDEKIALEETKRFFKLNPAEFLSF